MGFHMLCVCLAAASTVTGAQSDSKLIEPGKRLGKLNIGDVIDELKWLKKSDYGDAQTGHEWQTWEAKKPDPRNGNILNSLDVYISQNEDGKLSIRLIRSTSPTFATKGKLKVGTAFAEVKKQFSSLTKLTSYASAQFSSRVAIYDDAAAGIGFEFKAAQNGVVAPSDKCLAVWVHATNMDPMKEAYPPVQYLIGKPGIKEAAKHSKG